MTRPLPPEPDPLLGLSDDARRDAAVRVRAEQRSRRVHAAAVASWIGTLRDVAERRLNVIVVTAAVGTCQGRLTAVGRDYVALRRSDASVSLIALDALRSVRPDPGTWSAVATGDRGAAQDRTLMESLDRLAEQRCAVEVHLDGLADPVRGELVGCGQDVLTVRTTSGDRGLIYLPARAVVQVLWTPAG